MGMRMRRKIVGKTGPLWGQLETLHSTSEVMAGSPTQYHLSIIKHPYWVPLCSFSDFTHQATLQETRRAPTFVLRDDLYQLILLSRV